MKLKYLLFLFMSFMLSCSTPEEFQDFLLNLTEAHFPDGTFGYVDISKDCDCLNQEYYWNCYDSYYLFKDDYNRILEMIEQSNYPCIYVNGIDVKNNSFEGFVLNYGLY